MNSRKATATLARLIAKGEFEAVILSELARLEKLDPASPEHQEGLRAVGEILEHAAAIEDAQQAKHLRSLIGTIHIMRMILPNGGRVTAVVRIDALDGDDCRHTIIFAPPDPLATAAGPQEFEKFVSDAVAADLRAIVLGRREPQAPSGA